MNRKEFFKNTLLASGLLFTGQHFACSKSTSSIPKAKVIVAGAGIAGLTAAQLLYANGFEVVIYEARNTHGGRLSKIDNFVSYPIDGGAQWMHGTNNLLGRLAMRNRIKLTADPTFYTFWFQNKLVGSLPHDIEIFDKPGLPDVSYLQYASSQGLTDEYYHILQGVSAEYGASAENLSAYWNYVEQQLWSSGEEDYKFESTYFDFVDAHVAANVKHLIKYNTPIVEIDYSGRSVKIASLNDLKDEADYVIITVPLSVLKKNTIRFYPELPQNHINAIEKIGIEPGIKVFMHFRQKFYNDFVMGGKHCATYMNERVGKNGTEEVLLAFVMGNQARELIKLDEHAIIRTLINELDEMYGGKASANFVKGLVVNWANQPFIHGAYSYSSIGIGDARLQLASEINNKIFFAGEAVNTNGHHQTVHGAAESAIAQAQKIIAIHKN